MSTLTHAPLIEAIVEVRWGSIVTQEGNQAYNFPVEDTDFFPGLFRSVAHKHDYKFVENILPKDLPHFPHLISYRFRKAPNTWPCYQLGLGIFTINQVNDGYGWKTFKQDILKGLEMVNESHPSKLSGLSPIGIALTYQDGLIFDKDESPIDFLKNKLNISFCPPEELLSSEFFCERTSATNLSINIVSNIPKGTLTVNFAEAKIKDQLGLVMNTTLRSSDECKPSFDTGSLERWLEDAHNANEFAFKSLLTPEYMENFK